MRAEGYATRTVQTRTRQVATLTRHATGRAGHRVQAHQVTTMQLVEWLSGDLTAKTRVTYYETAHAWFGWLVRRGERDDDPTEEMKRPRASRGTPHPVPLRFVQAVLDDPPGLRAYAYVVLASFAGLRAHEVAGMRGGYVDADARLLRLPGKGGRVDTLPAHDRIVMLARGMPDRGWWFPGREKGHVRPQTVSRHIKLALARAGYDGTAHSCRHFFGTQVLRASRDLRVAQELLRHASPATTAIYTAVADRDRRWAIDRLGETA